ncbi:uncharacterized protein LOC144007955 isoform X2 [Festucalex cinctus]
MVVMTAGEKRSQAEPADEGAGVEGKVLLPGVDLQGFNSLNGVSCCSEHCITPHCVECSPLSICCILEGDWSLHLGFLGQVDFGGFFLPGPLGCLRLQKEPESVASNHSSGVGVGRERGTKIHQMRCEEATWDGRRQVEPEQVQHQMHQ